MTPKVSQLNQHGTKTWAHLTGNQVDLETFARRLHLEIHGAGHGKGREKHLDLTEHERELAIRYGAREEEEKCRLAII